MVRGGQEKREQSCIGMEKGRHGEYKGQEVGERTKEEEEIKERTNLKFIPKDILVWAGL